MFDGPGDTATELIALGMNHLRQELEDLGLSHLYPMRFQVLQDAVRKMSLQDAKAILSGGEDSVTQYFRRTSSEALNTSSRTL